MVRVSPWFPAVRRSPTTGAPVATSFMQPRNSDDLKRRSAAFRIAAEATLGLMGRSPLAAFDDSVLSDGAALYTELALQHLQP